MTDPELDLYTRELIAQADKIKRSLMEITIYGNGSYQLADLFSLPMRDIDMLQKIMEKKLKSDKGVKGKEFL